MTASRSSSVRHLHEACRMRLSFSNSLYRPFFRSDIEVVHGIGGLPRLVNTSPHRDSDSWRVVES
jgi:hypothetical protein